MKHALNTAHAAVVAPGHRLARLARQGVAVCVLACAAIGTAHAQYHGRRDDAQLPPPPSARGDRVADQQRGYEQMRDQMRDQQRDQRFYDEQRRRAPEMQQDAPRERRGGRLTPDERRDLRRQINEAGMDIYPNAQRR